MATLTHGSNFSDAFWDEQYKGVDIISSRLRKSKDTCEQIKKLYELRAHIEQEYGEKLLKLAQSTRIGEFEEASFAETLSRIPSILETTARAHMDLSQQLKDHLESPLDGFLKDQRDARKMEQQKIENTKQLLNLHKTDVSRAKDYYSNECQKLNSLEKKLVDLIEKCNQSEDDELIKDIHNLEIEIEEQKRMVAVADQVYKRSIDNLNAINDNWVNDWKTSTNAFQEMEVKRITYLRDTLWSFSNMMTSTLNIDEECCDRIRTALEITDVNKDITYFVQRYGTGTQIPASSPYETLYLPNSIHIPSLLKIKSKSLPTNSTVNQIDTRRQSDPTEPITILTNPDEELKSVERQLKQLEVQSQSFDDQPLSSTTDHSNGPVSNAIKEVESILNPKESFVKSPTSIPTNDNRSVHSNNRLSLQMDKQQQQQQQQQAPSITEDFSSGIYNALGLNQDNLAPLSDTETTMDDGKYKPMPNPNFNNNQTRPHVNVRSSSLNMIPKEEQDEDEEEYTNHMPRPPPKDEKWMISSIRRPQQLPVRTLNAKIFDGASSTRSSVVSPNIEQQQETNKEELQPHQPKLHKPVVPLSIDIPNSIHHAQNAAQQAIEEGRRISQMSPIAQPLDLNQQQRIEESIRPQQQRNMVDENIRPAPWQDNVNTNYMNGGYQPGPRNSSLKQHFIMEEQLPNNNNNNNKKKNKKEKEKSAGRFSLGIFNKKDKKKEKESNQEFTRPISQQYYHHHQPSSLNDIHSTSTPLPPPPPPPQDINRFIGFAKAQWPFEATIEGEMSFDVNETLGVIRRQADGWWEAERLSTGQRGLIPGNYMIDSPPPQL